MKAKMRNPVAKSPILGKGGAHTTAKSQLRHQSKQAIDSEIDLWREEVEFNTHRFNSNNTTSPFSDSDQESSTEWRKAA